MTPTPFIGRDCELSTTGVDRDAGPVSPFDVTRDVLAQIDTAFEPLGRESWKHARAYGGGWALSSDCLRHWTPNGQCYYADMSHVECATAETCYPRTFAAQSLSVVQVAEAARQRAEALDPDGRRFSLSTANVDMLDPSISWGTHLSLTTSRELWDDLFRTREHPPRFGFLVSAVAAAIPFFGAGYLMPLRNGSCTFSLSARAHHLSATTTESTTVAFDRGILNSRDEPHGDGHARLHLIGFDFALASSALLCSYLQCVLVAAENGFSGLNLYQPVHALRSWSWNLDPRRGQLRGTALLADGRQLTLPEYLREVTTVLLDMRGSGLIHDGVAPEAGELLPLILELTHRLDEGDVIGCAAHLDWAAKLLSLLHLCRAEGATLGDARTRLFDHDFGNTDPERGHFWSLWESGAIDPQVSQAQVAACLEDGPAEGRGWGRGRLIQRFASQITDIDWSTIELERSGLGWAPRLRIELPALDSLCEESLAPVLSGADDLDAVEEQLRGGSEASVRDSDPVTDIRDQLAVPTWARAHGTRREMR